MKTFKDISRGEKYARGGLLNPALEKGEVTKM